MASYYKVANLVAGQSIELSDSRLRVKLSSENSQEVVESDWEMLRAVSSENYFWVSGGGTYLVEERFLVVVQRHSTARVNPNLLSLFTGRASGYNEWINPQLLLRELFEELVLVKNGVVLRPNLPGLPSFNEVFSSHQETIGSADLETKFLAANIVDVSNRDIEIVTQDSVRRLSAFIHGDYKNDLNILFLARIDVGLSDVEMFDAELAGVPRQLFFLDLKDFRLREYRKLGEEGFWLSASNATSHLWSFASAARLRLGL